MLTSFEVAFIAFAYAFVFSVVHGYLLENDHVKSSIIWASLGFILNGFSILFKGWDEYSQDFGDSMIYTPYIIVGLIPGLALGYYIGFNFHKFYKRW